MKTLLGGGKSVKAIRQPMKNERGKSYENGKDIRDAAVSAAGRFDKREKTL
ncbi:MAG: hypothetical protein Q4G07_06090 [Oscillospiraceae bacterium]|nr:hypothetical protein [Oscillospiraceae bacterium]